MVICKSCPTSLDEKHFGNSGQNNNTDKQSKYSSVVGEISHFLTRFDGTFMKYQKVSGKVTKILLFFFVPFFVLILFMHYSVDRKPVFNQFYILTGLNVFRIAGLFILLPLLLKPVYKFTGLSEMNIVYISFVILLIYLSIFPRNVLGEDIELGSTESFSFVLYFLFFSFPFLGPISFLRSQSCLFNFTS